MKNMNLFQIQGLNPVFGKDSYLNNVEFFLAILQSIVQLLIKQPISLKVYQPNSLTAFLLFHSKSNKKVIISSCN